MTGINHDLQSLDERLEALSRVELKALALADYGLEIPVSWAKPKMVQAILQAAEEKEEKEEQERAALADQMLESELLAGETDNAPKLQPHFAMPLAPGEVALTQAQKNLIATLNPDATPGELEVFYYQCARTGLDPIAGQIHLVIRRSGDERRAILQTAIDGYRLVAARTGLMAGSDDPAFAGDKDETSCAGGKRPGSATVSVWRIAADGQRYPYTATARWDEYAPSLDSNASFMWRKLPYLMLGKCAEALALRKAFPNELSGIYTDVEMDQARQDPPTRRGGGTPAPANLTRFSCPVCQRHGRKVPVVDNHAKHNAATGEKKPPVWQCSAGKNCAAVTQEKSKYAWGSWDEDEFAGADDSGELPDQPRVEVQKPSMSGILKVAPDPTAACRKWVMLAHRNDKGEAAAFHAMMVDRDHTWQKMEGITAADALRYEAAALALIAEMEAPFDGEGK